MTPKPAVIKFVDVDNGSTAWGPTTRMSIPQDGSTVTDDGGVKWHVVGIDWSHLDVTAPSSVIVKLRKA